MSCVCPFINYMSVMYESAHDAITFQLLEMSSITTPNQKQFQIFAQGRRRTPGKDLISNPLTGVYGKENVTQYLRTG